MRIGSAFKYNTSFLVFIAILAALPSFLASYNFVLNLFYDYGASPDDQTNAAFAMWRNNFGIELLPAIQSFWQGSLLNHHVYLVLSTCSFVTQFLDIDMIHFFALHQAIIHGLIALSLFYILVEIYNLKTRFGVLYSFIASVLFSFSSSVVSAIIFPHNAIYFMPMAIFFLAFCAQKKLVPATIFFILALLAREETGFLLSLFLLFLLVTHRICNKNFYKPYFVFFGIAFFWSVLLIGIQKYYSGKSSALDTYISLDHGLFSHLSWELLKERLLFIINYRPNFYIPIILVVLWSIIMRNPSLSFGIIALFPWFVFNLCSVSQWASRLHLYYGVYYMIMFIWPLIVVKISLSPKEFDLKKKANLFYGSIVIGAAVFLANPFNINDFELKPSVSQVPVFNHLQTALNYNKYELGNVAVDLGVLSLAPKAFTQDDVMRYKRKLPRADANPFYEADPRIEENNSIDSIFFYYPGFDQDLAVFYTLTYKLPFFYRVMGTNVYLATNRSLNDLYAFRSILVPEHYFPVTVFLEGLVHIFNNALYRKEDVFKKDEAYIIPQNSTRGVALYTTPIPLPKGRYQLDIRLKSGYPLNLGKPLLTIDFASQNEALIFFKEDIYYEEDFKERGIRKFEFDIPGTFPDAAFSIRVFPHQNAEVIIEDIKLVPIISTEQKKEN